MKNLKNIIVNNIGTIALIIVFILTMVSTRVLVNKNENLKRELSSIDNAYIVKNTREIQQHKRNSDYYLDKIQKIEAQLEEARSVYEYNILARKCKIEQNNRYLEGLEVVDDFCKDEQNLEQFRQKKK